MGNGSHESSQLVIDTKVDYRDPSMGYGYGDVRSPLSLFLFLGLGHVVKET